jgi:hypothetical protein
MTWPSRSPDFAPLDFSLKVSQASCVCAAIGWADSSSSADSNFHLFIDVLMKLNNIL